MTTLIVFAVLGLFCKLPTWLITTFIMFSYTLIYKNEFVVQANQMLAQEIHNSSLVRNKSEPDFIITAEIITLVNTKKGLSFTTKVDSLDESTLVDGNPNLYLTWPSFNKEYSPIPQLNDQWRFKIKIEQLPGHPEFFDYKNYQLSNEVLYQGVIFDGELLEKGSSYRQYIYNRIALNIAPETNGLLLALAFGNRSFITNAQWELYSRFGLSHLIAISGLHIGLIYTFALVLLKIITRLTRVRISAITYSVIGISVAACYAWLAGFGVTTIRALMLLVIVNCYLLMRTKSSTIHKYALMLCLCLIIMPFSLHSVSFLLSFSAIGIVFFILWYLTSHKVNFENGIAYFLNVIKYAVMFQFLLFFIMLPLQLVLFNGFSYLTPVINLFIVPLFTLVVIPALFISSLATFIFPVMSKVTIDSISKLLDRIDNALIMINQYHVSWVQIDHVTFIEIILYVFAISIGLYRTFRHLALPLLVLLVIQFMFVNDNFSY